jgi:predicted dehydrogenase
VQLDSAQALAQHGTGVYVTTDWREVVARNDIDIIIVATTNDQLAEITIGALNAGKHILVEKPAARNPRELQTVIEAARLAGTKVRVGFNHRYHPAFQQARRLLKDGLLGDLMFVRARYGHGGRLGYEKEWRAQPRLSGGGELLDQGVHLIDLARWFLGDFLSVEGSAHTYYWKMPVDDNAFILLKTAREQSAFLHASCTEWKNTFSFEIYGRDAKLHIEGLGGSYGVERLSYYRMLPQMGPPDTTIWEYPGADRSWQAEFSDFVDDIRLNRETTPGLDDAHAALTIVDAIYKQSGYDFSEAQAKLVTRG